MIGGDDGCIYITSEDVKSIKSGFCHHAYKGAEMTKFMKGAGSVTSIYCDNNKNVLITGAKVNFVVYDSPDSGSI